MPGLSASGNEFTVNSFATGFQDYPEIASLEGGGYVIVWTNYDATYDGDGYGLAGQVFDGDGNPVGAEFSVNTEVENGQDRATVVGLSGGGFVVTWFSGDTDIDADGGGVSAQIFDASGNKVGGEFTVNTELEGGQREPDVTSLEGGGFVITWHSGDPDVDGDGSGISAQIFDAGGNPVGGEFTVNTEVEGTQSTAVVAGLKNGGFVIAWESSDADVDGDGTGVAAQIFDALGNPVGSEFTVNTEVESHQYNPAIAALSNGGFVISWRSQDPDVDISSSGIAARVFDASGSALGDEFTVNTEGGFGQAQTSITAVSNGGFVISWSNFNAAGDGDGASVSAQLFDAGGNKVGTETTINERVTNGQQDANVAYLGGKDVVFTWISNDTTVDGDGSGIAARAFSFSLPRTYDHSEKPTSSLNTTTASDGDDMLEFGMDDDTVAAGAGDDYVDGGQGDDEISGGTGNDTIEGGDGVDLIFGGAGADKLYGTNISNENGDLNGNLIWGGQGDDVIVGGLGADTLGGGADADDIAGGLGADLIYGGAGNDTLNGQSGNDMIFGGQGDDTLAGGTGQDTLWGGAGNDVLSGGAGEDVFVFGAVSGDDTISDFDVADDTLLVSYAGITDFAALQAAASDTTVDGQDGVLIDLGDSGSVFIVGLSVSDLEAVTLG